jgi:hypothetical protein
VKDDTDNPPCIKQGCPRRSRNKKKPGMCSTCLTRERTGGSPKFPAQPLLDAMERRGISWNNYGGRPNQLITLERMDAICIDVLEVHPYEVYGPLYFQECVA